MARVLYLVDASVFIFRAYYSVPIEVADPEGNPVNAVHGFARFLIDLVQREAPEHIAIAFDESLEQSYRNEIYPAYKANREPADEALLRQFGHCRAVTRALGLAALADARYEADDLIGTLAGHAHTRGDPVLVLSADKDLTQLLRHGDLQWDYPRDTRYDCAAVRARFGVDPDQIADMLALAGDPVDNIPGVHGVGQLTAARLLRHFGTLDGLLERLDEVGSLPIRGAKGIQQRLTEQREQALLSRRLTLIARDAPVPPLDDLAVAAPDLDALDSLFERCGFGPFLRRRVVGVAARRAGAAG